MRTARTRPSQATAEPDYLPALRDRIRRLESEGAGADLHGDLVALTAVREFLLSEAVNVAVPELAKALALLTVTKTHTLQARVAAETQGYVDPQTLRQYIDRLMKLLPDYVPPERHEALARKLRLLADDRSA